MRLDYVNSTRIFTLRVDRGEADIRALMKEQGFNLWEAGSTASQAVLTTKEPYAAAHFHEYATEKAMLQLINIVAEVKTSWADTSSASIRCPDDQELMPFQKASVEYALKRQNCLIGDQPGLGKTPIAICFANEIRAKRVLVICPAGIRRQWVERINTWTMLEYPYVVYAIENSRNGVHPTAGWTVISYELARTEAIGKALAKGRYDLLILDEAHYLKTIDSRRTRAVFGGGETSFFAPLASRCDRVLALTGTALPNRPREAYVLARNLCFDAIDWMSEAKFGERFNPVARMEKRRPDGSVKVYTKEEVGRAGELQNRLRANFMVRHLKRDVMPQLKLPAYDIIRVEETGAVKQAIAAEKLLDIDPEMIETVDFEILGAVATVRRVMGVAIAPQAADYAEMLLDGGEEKIVVFAWHKEVLDILEKRLHKHGVVRVDGSTNANQKAERVGKFIKNPAVHFIIGNTLSLGTGTDGLQLASSHVLLVEPDWVPGNNEQAIDRLDRSGQRRTVQADLFVAPGSLLERVLASALRKGKNVHKALDERF